MFLSKNEQDANQVRKWSTQSREAAPWYLHETIGFNHRMSNIIAGVVRGNFLHIDEHIAQKKAIYERYKEGFKDLPITLNPFDLRSEPNYWLSVLLVDASAMCRQVRGDKDYLYITEPGKSCPQEILDAIAAINAEGRPFWRPMHMQPLYRMHDCVGREGSIRAKTNTYIAGGSLDVGADIFERGCCLPSDNKMTVEEQDRIIDVIRRCFA